MITFSNRLQALEQYYFSKKLTEVRDLISQGKQIINMGVGNPDLSPPPKVVLAIKNSLNQPDAHTYQRYQGLLEFRCAIAQFYEKKYRVFIKPSNEILPLMGSKEGIMHISLALLSKNDQVLIPNPGYPTYSSVTRLVGAKPVFYSLDETHNWQPNFEELEQYDLSKVKLMWVNYPHMPTGSKAQQEIFKKLISFGKKKQIVIVNDNPYSFILNDNPQSILQIKGAKDIALELNSLSKSFNMAGWRVGMVLGSEYFINTILKVKTQMDSGMFYGIQKGAIAALKLSNQWFSHLNTIYTERRKLIWELATKLHCTFSKDTSGMFVWAKLSEGKKSEETTDRLLYDHHIFVTPGTVFGSKGEGYIRISLCTSQKQIKQAIDRL